MLRQRIRQSFRSNGLPFQIMAGCGFGLLLGMALLGFSPLLVLGLLAAVVFAYAAIKRPEFALLAILVATSSIIFEDQLPSLSVGGISLHISDLILLLLLGLIVLRWLVEPDFKIVRTPLDWPLLIFYAVTLISTFIAINQSSVDAVDARRWIRYLSYYLTFFIVTNLVRDRRQLNFLLNGLFLLATIVAAAMVAQFLMGNSLQFLPGRVESLATQNTVYADITRILPPGISIIQVSFVTLICTLVLEKFKPFGWLKFLQCGLMGMGLLLTFLRSYWAVLIGVLFIMMYLFKGYERQRLIGWGLVVLCAAAMIMVVVFSAPESRAMRLVGASIARLSTLTTSGEYQGQDTSLNYRMIENGYALTAIAAHPIIGMGMGFTFRPWDSRLDWRTATAIFDYRQHIHNSYLWILLQSGLLGFLSFIWLSIVFLIRGFKYWRSIADDHMRGVVLGFTLTYVTVLIAGLANSTVMQWEWIPVIGILMSANEVIYLKFKPEEQVV